MKSVQIIVKGKVQGVYFRASAKQRALMLGVSGTIQNQQDGSVCIEANGEQDQLQNMVDWCRKGPALARVKGVEVKEVSSQETGSFKILH
ncbi:MAG: acylphosphatase [Bacteroidia bacterium]